MNINKIIEWCNNNEGFAMVMVTVATLIVSVIAIIISIKTSRLPYKKKLLLVVGSFIGIGIDTIGIHITATNIGNRNIKVKNMGLFINKQCYTNMKTIKESQITLSVGESTTQYFESKDLKSLKELDFNYKVYGCVEDTEGKRYKKYLCRVNKLF